MKRIVKSRIRQGVACYEVEWDKTIDTGTLYVITIVKQDLKRTN